MIWRVSMPESAGHAGITLDATRAACWQGVMTCDRLTAAGTQGDVELDTKLDALPPVRADADWAGTLVDQDDSNFLRFEVQALNQFYRVDAHEVIGGVGTSHLIACDNLTLTAPVSLRVVRVQDVWTLSYSTDGTTFTACGSFTQALTVSQVGLHADDEASDPTAFHAVSFADFHVATDDAPTSVATYVDDVNGSLPNVLTDGLGSVRVITDGAGNVIQTYQTDAFGVPAQSLGSSSQPFQFTGPQSDAGSGLYYLRARMYDPTVGRFLSRDPLRGVTTDPPSLDRYLYARNNPTDLADPAGLAANRVMRDAGGPAALALAACEVGTYPGQAQICLDERALWAFFAALGAAAGVAAESTVDRSQGQIYYRLESPTQTPEVAKLQQATGQIWGRAPQGSSFPAVQAYRGPLPPGARGIEFVTSVAPDPGSPPGLAYWRPARPGVRLQVSDKGEEFAVLEPVIVTKNTQAIP